MATPNAVQRFFNVGNPNWVVRRRIVITSLMFCAVEVIWASEWMRVETAPAIISQAFTMATLIISGYVIANVADDHFKRKVEAEALESKPNDMDNH